MQSPFEKMDKMYRLQRYFYDFTRKYYLLGRDKLIAEMDIEDGENVLEVGCGTGRNLKILAEKHPQTNFFGLDASAAMLETAAKKVVDRQIQNIKLQAALADTFAHDKTFSLEDYFDSIYFSYSISMIPTWKESIQNALQNLKSGRSLYIVDFYDQRDLPAPFRKLLQAWLKQFHVRYPAELIPYLESIENEGVGKLSVKSIFRSYAFIVKFEKA